MRSDKKPKQANKFKKFLDFEKKKKNRYKEFIFY